MRRTRDDKRRAVRILLQDAEWRQWSDRAIARQCHVSDLLVFTLREEMAHHGSSFPSRRRSQRTNSCNGQKHDYTFTMPPPHDVPKVRSKINAETKENAGNGDRRLFTQMLHRLDQFDALARKTESPEELLELSDQMRLLCMNLEANKSTS